MTPIARLKACGPSNLAVVTNAAKLALSNRIHGDFVCSRLHLENGRVTGVALVPDPMKPMRENRDSYSSLATFSFENDISVHSERCANKKDGHDGREE